MPVIRVIARAMKSRPGDQRHPVDRPAARAGGAASSVSSGVISCQAVGVVGNSL